MRRDIKNNKVVKAIALGLATSILMAQPLSASAHEADVPETNDDVNPNAEENQEADSVYGAAEDAIIDAQDAITDAHNAMEEATEDTGVEPDPETETSALQDAGDAMESAEANMIATEAAQNAADEDAAKANEIFEEIEENNAEITEQSRNADDAVAKAEEALQEAKDATTKEAAQAAVDKADEAVQEAQQAKDAAQAAYDDNTEKLDAAKLELEKARENFEAAQNSFDATKEEVAAAEKLLAEAEKEAADLEAQVAADKAVLEQSKENELKTAYDKMIAQSNLLSKVYNGESATAEDANNDGIGDEFTDGFGKETANSKYWDAAREYFKLYIEYIYGDSFQSGTWTKKKIVDNDMAYDAAVDNTYTVTYVDAEGNLQTAYYNYHTSVDPEKKGDITIYEKEKATAWTEDVYEMQTEEFENTREVTNTWIEQEERSETTYEDALSIENTDQDGNTTYIKLSDVQKEGDVVLATGTDEAGNATSVLVKDANSALVSKEVCLGDNQVVMEGTQTESYEVQTIQIPVSYGTKEEEVAWKDKISTYDELKRAYNAYTQQYSAEEGYVVRLYLDHTDGGLEEITLDSAKDFDKQLESFFMGWLDKGYEIGVFQTVEDTNNVTEWTEQQVIVKTTTASVETTTYTEMKATGEAGDRDRARTAAMAKVAELGLAEGEYSISYQEFHENIFDKDCRYTITYHVAETSVSTETVSKESYSGTAYGMNNIGTTRTWMEDVEKSETYTETFTDTREVKVLVEAAREYEYWTERRNTSHDETIAGAIEDVEEKLNDMSDKQAKAQAAAEAVNEAAQAVADAKAELEKISVTSEEYDAALAAYETAVVNQEEAVKVLEEMTQEVEKAEETYKEAAAELGRFVPAPSNDPVEDVEGEPEETPEEVEPEAEPEAEEPVAEEPVAEEPAETPEAEETVEVPAEKPVADETVEIEDEDTPLAQGTDAEEAEEEAQETVEIADEETPLAAGTADVKEGPMNFWWAIIVAILGATGYEMYRRHNLKKAKKEVEDK